jgi:hypothetical protein
LKISGLAFSGFKKKIIGLAISGPRKKLAMPTSVNYTVQMVEGCTQKLMFFSCFQFDCADCISGPAHPDIESCGLGNSSTTSTSSIFTAVLIGGFYPENLQVSEHQVYTYYFVLKLIFEWWTLSQVDCTFHRQLMAKHLSLC